MSSSAVSADSIPKYLQTKRKGLSSYSSFLKFPPIHSIFHPSSTQSSPSDVFWSSQWVSCFFSWIFPSIWSLSFDFLYFISNNFPLKPEISFVPSIILKVTKKAQLSTFRLRLQTVSKSSFEFSLLLFHLIFFQKIKELRKIRLTLRLEPEECCLMEDFLKFSLIPGSLPSDSWFERTPKSPLSESWAFIPFSFCFKALDFFANSSIVWTRSAPTELKLRSLPW